MSTTKKNKNEVDLTTPTNPLQEQGKTIDVEDTPPTEDKPKVHINVGDDADENPYVDKPIVKQQATYDMPDYTDYENSKVRAAEFRHDIEREGEERRQNNRRIMTAIGDGLSGLANIYFTSQGTPDLLKGAPSLTGKMQERYDKMRKDAETRRANYLKVVQESADQKVKDMYTRYKDSLEAKRKEEELELKRKKDARDEIKAEVQAEKARLYNDYLQGRISEQEWKTKTAEAEAKNAPTYYENRAKKAGYIGSRGSSGKGSSGGSGRKGSGDSYTTIKETTTDTFNPLTGVKEKKTTTSKTTRTPGGSSKSKPTGKKASSVSYKRKKNT